ncbi:MAG: von Willebrand factor type A domain-containing protein [Ferruginibacter sp.]
MKTAAIYLFLFFVALNAQSQYYFRGEVRDLKYNTISNVKVYAHSNKSIYKSGRDGSFGIMLKQPYDSMTFSLDGYETVTLSVKSDAWNGVTLKQLSTGTANNKSKLISETKDRSQQNRANWSISDETYFQLVENEFVDAVQFPNTGFSLNVNKASYSNVRRFLKSDSPVPPDAVKIEELVNYFNLHYRKPDSGHVFKIESQISDCPWNEKNQLLFLNINAQQLNLKNIPPGNFVFLIDVSGSMDTDNKLPLIKGAFQLFLKNLRSIDTVSIVTYGGSVAVWMQPTSGAEKEFISKKIEELEAAGDTPGESAIRLAYRVATKTFIKNGTNRVILATDGDFNVGETTEEALEDLIFQQRQTGVYLTCLGVGMGNLKDSKLQALAKKGNGNYAYLDNIMEAEKTLVLELTQTMFAVAGEVTFNIKFNKSMVKEYRLIGFDNRKEALLEQGGVLEGGEVGSGNSTLAIFEIVPTQENILSKDFSKSENIAKATINYTLGKKKR